MRIVFIGAVAFSQSALQCLFDINARVVGVCTLESSKFNADHVDLSNVCRINDVPSLYATDINSRDTLNWIFDKKPDIIFCFGWSKLLKEDLLTLVPLGVIGFHPAALPANRGRHALIWALVLGLKKTASTFFFMETGADNGDILDQREIIIDDADDADSLYKKVTLTALEQIEYFVPKLSAGQYQRIKQDHSLANTWRKRSAADGKIDWRMSSASIHNLVRGLAKPYVGAHFVFEDKEIKVWKAEIVNYNTKNIEPGKVLFKIHQGIVVKCGEGAICLLETEPICEIQLGISL